MTSHLLLQAAIDLAIQGQNAVIKGVSECHDPAHKAKLVKVSGMFNKLAHDIYLELERLEPADDEDGTLDQP